MKNKIIFLCIAFLFIAVNLFADTITLKSGQEIEGKILERTEESVKIEVYGVELTYYMSEIDKINKENIVSTVEEPRTAITEEGSSDVAGVSEPIQIQEPKSADVPISSSSSIPANQKDKTLKVIAAVTVIVIMFVFLLLYIYSSLCLQFIAKKTNQEPAWLAWIPIANLFLMCKIASLNYVWLFGFLLVIIPYIGVFFTLALMGYFWYKIALARNKPGWLGILILLPLVNFVIMGYLAFSE